MSNTDAARLNFCTVRICVLEGTARELNFFPMLQGTYVCKHCVVKANFMFFSLPNIILDASTVPRFISNFNIVASI